MKNKFVVICTIAWAVSLVDLFGQTNDAAAADQVWVPEHATPDGTVVPGHWRPAGKPGFIWIDGRLDGPNWVAGYWKPVGPAPVGKIWAAGYWRNSRWHDGRWVSTRKGNWVPGHYGKHGRRIPGHYR
ncbi:MAG: hypothetical protein V1789_00300 [PVC group bacterium]